MKKVSKFNHFLEYNKKEFKKDFNLILSFSLENKEDNGVKIINIIREK